jgi:hypothetical protein
MGHLTTDHGVSWYFGTRLAPITLTCSLRISNSHASDNLTPQETTEQDTPIMGPGRTGSDDRHAQVGGLLSDAGYRFRGQT